MAPSGTDDVEQRVALRGRRLAGARMAGRRALLVGRGRAAGAPGLVLLFAPSTSIRCRGSSRGASSPRASRCEHYAQLLGEPTYLTAFATRSTSASA